MSPALNRSGPPPLARLRQIQLLKALAREAGWRHLAWLSGLSSLSSLLDIAGVGLAVTLLLGSGSRGQIQGLPVARSLGILVGLILLRGLIQAQVAIQRERLRSGFTDRLRQQLLHQVFEASSTQLDRLGRGELLALLMADINRTALSLDQAVRMGQSLLAMGIYLASVVLVGRATAWPLLLALLATTAAALLQRSGSWGLGRIQNRLNAALQRTVGDGLHGLKALRAATAESWLLQRFARETAEGRWLLRERVRRRANYNAWRDTLVVAVAGLWMLLREEALTAETLTTTLVLAYRASASLSTVVQARRLCLGNLPGYEALRQRRGQLVTRQGEISDRTIADASLIGLSKARWSQLHWSSSANASTGLTSLDLSANGLVALAGPSGSGKTTLIDRVCGLLNEEDSHWQLKCADDTWRLSGLAGARQMHQLIAYAPQNAVLFEASLRDNLLLGANCHQDDIETWLQLLGLAHLLQRQGGLDAPLALAQDPFSGGEIHRLGLLRAWLRDKPLEVLDEPTAFLDAKAAKQVRSVIRERAQQRLMLISSHDPELLAQADQVITMKPTPASPPATAPTQTS
ncbi:MAG: ABC transporter ATP-binding protein/permease [Cyanobacteriota bacterium]|nr:ABC transporter ATP-binding protein/permease [Cyanobacteriota bacterium]